MRNAAPLSVTAAQDARPFAAWSEYRQIKNGPRRLLNRPPWTADVLADHTDTVPPNREFDIDGALDIRRQPEEMPSKPRGVAKPASALRHVRRPHRRRFRCVDRRPPDC
jgi:hypothetical protein